MKKIIIAAVAKNNVIGRSDGKMPWYIKEEFEHFKKTTLGCPVIMGRKTFESLGSPLADRLNIVITRKISLKKQFSEIIIFESLKDAYEFCKSENFESIFIIGGSGIFHEAIKDVDEMIISHINFQAEGDVYFPKIDLNYWIRAVAEKRKEFEIVHYRRKNSGK